MVVTRRPLFTDCAPRRTFVVSRRGASIRSSTGDGRRAAQPMSADTELRWRLITEARVLFGTRAADNNVPTRSQSVKQRAPCHDHGHPRVPSPDPDPQSSTHWARR